MIIDSDSKEPVPDALVLVYFSSVYIGGRDSYVQGYVKTDAAGRFRIDPRPEQALAQHGDSAISFVCAHPDYHLYWSLSFDAKDELKLREQFSETQLKRLGPSETGAEHLDIACKAMPEDACERVKAYLLD